MKAKASRRFLSLLLSAIMVFGLVLVTPISAAASDQADEIQFSDSGKYVEKDISNATIADSALTYNKTQVTAKLNLAAAGLTKEDADYVEQLAESMKHPLGALGFDDMESDERVDIIVQFDTLPASMLKAYNSLHEIKNVNHEKVAAAPLSSFKAGFSKAEKAQISFGYDFHEVFNGVGMTVPANMIGKIAAMDGVLSVSPDYMMYADVDNPIDYFEVVAGGMMESREILRTTELNDMGITGAGVKVGVLDTGIDYNHPDLKDAYKGGHDYIGAAVAYLDASSNIQYLVQPTEDDDPMETTYEDWLAAYARDTRCAEARGSSEYYTSHGTHVSGTIAARGENTDSPYNTLGIAPEVDLYVYRVLGPYGSGPSTGIIKAVDQSVIDGMQVINLSLGANQDTAYGADVFALNNACIAGTIVCVSAGNNALGSGTVRNALTLGTPGTAYLPITVAASQYGGGPLYHYNQASMLYGDTTVSGVSLAYLGSGMDDTFEDGRINTSGLTYVEDKGYRFTLVGGGAATLLEQVTALTDNSLAGQILIVKRGSMNFTDMADQGKRLGAGAVIIINGDGREGYVSGTTIDGEKPGGIPVLSTLNSLGGIIASAYAAAAGEPIYINLGALTESVQPKEPADFSSIGPVTETIGLKPDIIAPGYNIMSTQPAFFVNPDHNATDYYGAYKRMGGTSMSAPHMTGIAVLMRQSYPDASVAEIKARLMNTADPTLIESGFAATPTASVFEVGAGFVNPWRALVTDRDVYITLQDDIPGQTSGTVIENQTLSSMSFGFVTPGTTAAVETRELGITVHNTGAAEKTFAISASYNDDTAYSLSSAANGVTLQTDKTSVTVAAGGTATVTAKMVIPANTPIGRFEGYLHFTAGESDYVVPFACSTEDPPEPFIINDAWLIRPVITANTDSSIRQSQYSNTTPFALGWTGAWPGDLMDVYLCDMNNNIVGYYGTYSGMGEGDGDATLFIGAVTYQAYPVSESGDITPVKSTIAEGAYQIAISDDTWYYIIGGLVVDNQRPVLTFDADPPVYEYVNGEAVVHIKGNIWSHAGEVLVASGITSDNYVGSPLIGQELNGLVLGSTIYRYCDENGDFDIPLSVTDASKTGSVNLSSYATDYYSTTYYLLLGVFLQSANIGNNRTNGTVTVSYTQSPLLSELAAGNGLAEAALSYNPRLIAPTAGDFTVEYSANGGEKAPLAAEFSYDSATATASLAFEQFAAPADYTVYVTYKGVTMSGAFAVEAPVTTVVSVTTPTIVATLAANLSISATDEELTSENSLVAYLKAGDDLLYPTALTYANGKWTGRMAIAQAPAYGVPTSVVVAVDGAAPKAGFVMTIADYNPAELWNPTLTFDSESGNTLVVFGDTITHKAGGKITVTVDGRSTSYTLPDDGRSILVNAQYESLAEGTKIVAAGVKYPVLFPSYSFTFTITK